MKQYLITIDETVKGGCDALAAEHGCSKSAAVRALIELGLAARAAGWLPEPGWRPAHTTCGSLLDDAARHSAARALESVERPVGVPFVPDGGAPSDLL
jgi:hypothetical protein